MNKPTYRYDIQGLRAISSLIIMICHIWLNKVSGGVDIFFVISGFFMTAVLFGLRQKQQSNIYFEFWDKILKKILPTAIIVIVLTLIASFILHLPSQIDLLNHASKSIVFLENIFLIKKDLDYLDSGIFNPFQQFWALSIQFQFYLFFPLIFILLNWEKKKIIYIVSFFIIFSFIYGVYLTYIDPSKAYYHPIARFWEFLVGSIIFLTYDRIKIKKYGAYFSLFSLILFIAFSFFIPTIFSFPGFIALVPVIIASLIILNSDNNSEGNILKNPLLIEISKYSFTLYLVHWPVLTLYKFKFVTNKVTIIDGVLIILISLLLSKIIYEFINNGIWGWYYNLKIKKSLFLGFMMVLILSVILSEFRGMVREKYKKLYDEFYNLNIDISKYSLKDIALASDSIGWYKGIRECMTQEGDSKVKICTYGNINSSKKIVLAGGSHIAQWIPVFDYYGKQNNYQIVQITKGNCPINKYGERYSEDCHVWNKNLVTELKKINNLQILVTNSTRTYNDRILNNHKEDIPADYIEAWESIEKETNLKILGIRDNPRYSQNPNECLLRENGKPDICKYERNPIYFERGYSDFLSDKIISLDFSDYYCDEKYCYSAIDKIPVYIDDQHLSSVFLYRNAEKMSSQIHKVISSL